MCSGPLHSVGGWMSDVVVVDVEGNEEMTLGGLGDSVQWI